MPSDQIPRTMFFGIIKYNVSSQKCLNYTQINPKNVRNVFIACGSKQFKED